MTTSTPPRVATFTVTGMTCGHCVDSVTAEVGGIPGVTHVDVDLKTGALTVTSAAALDRAAVAAAVDEAGYALASDPATPAASCCGSCH
ncbi:heavy-metal-associated domain-containing protein [Streptomyces hoynatensis]|uniref:Copper chaperone n=1 Tax=Streptomyces hoynatensis TaxID=1141874 RepID=A0A3A9YWV7_9ACTN|nr:cation transporter [Streptomyces hoynatensis]RKN39706.1 copper chaperone [Streptomyces hoynatensis]